MKQLIVQTEAQIAQFAMFARAMERNRAVPHERTHSFLYHLEELERCLEEYNRDRETMTALTALEHLTRAISNVISIANTLAVWGEERIKNRNLAILSQIQHALAIFQHSQMETCVALAAAIAHDQPDTHTKKQLLEALNPTLTPPEAPIEAS